MTTTIAACHLEAEWDDEHENIDVNLIHTRSGDTVDWFPLTRDEAEMLAHRILDLLENV